jgi:gamma-glutamyltranspeptidase/glutathione hydrolase
VAARGSFLAAEDFAQHRGEAVAPIAGNYRGLDVLELPPNGQGLTALVLLNILERFDLGALDPNGPDRFHIALEAARMAYAVRDTHIADPAFMRTPVPALLDKQFAAELAGRIDRTRRVPLPAAPSPGSDTVYVTVVDRDRMAVSLINTLYSHFGVGICTMESGITLTNRGACFVVDSDHPNTFGPRKRPMHTIIPALAFRDGRCDMAFGVMGAHYQPMGHVQIVTNMIDHGMDVQAAIDAPRASFVGDETVIERGLPASTAEGLSARGHDVAVAFSPWGGAQAIRIDWQRGVLIGGSDPRKDGCALGY